MTSQSSYERIEFILQELRAQARPAAPTAAVSDSVAVQHVEALLALFQENLRALAQPGPVPPTTP